jgi:hypothetical protein
MSNTADQDEPNLFGGSLFGSTDEAKVKASGAGKEEEDSQEFEL